MSRININHNHTSFLLRFSFPSFAAVARCGRPLLLFRISFYFFLFFIFNFYTNTICFIYFWIIFFLCWRKIGREPAHSRAILSFFKLFFVLLLVAFCFFFYFLFVSLNLLKFSWHRRVFACMLYGLCLRDRFVNKHYISFFFFSSSLLSRDLIHFFCVELLN